MFFLLSVFPLDQKVGVSFHLNDIHIRIKLSDQFQLKNERSVIDLKSVSFQIEFTLKNNPSLVHTNIVQTNTITSLQTSGGNNKPTQCK